MRVGALVMISLFLVSCKHDNGSCGSIDCQAEDISGDAAFSFIDIEKVNTSFSDSEISVNINILDIPSSLTYNSINLLDNSLEYGWWISFDVDADNTEANDIQLGMLHFKPPSSVESQGGVLDFTQKNVWLVDSEGTSSSSVGDITVEIDNHIITFTVARSEYIELSNIDKSTPVKFKAFYSNSGEIYEDVHPDNGTYIK